MSQIPYIRRIVEIYQARLERLRGLYEEGAESLTNVEDVEVLLLSAQMALAEAQEEDAKTN